VKICLVRHGFFPADPTLRKVAFALREANHDVDVLCLRDPGMAAFETVKGVRVFRIPLSHRRRGIGRYLMEYGASFLGLTTLLTLKHMRLRYDYVQVHTMPDFLVYTAWLPRLLGTPVCIYVHEPTPELWVSKFGSDRFPWVPSFLARVQKRAVNYADCCFTVTETLRRNLGRRGADIRNIFVFHNVSSDFFDSPPPRARVPDGLFRLITHGSVEERYGHELVLRAMHLLWHRLPGLRYDILGEGEFRPHLTALVHKLGLQSRVRLLGRLPLNKVRQLLSDSDACIIPMHLSTYSELIDTYKMYEAVAMGKPVIISRLGGVEETFDDSCVRFINPGDCESLADAIVDLHDHPEKRRFQTERASARYKPMRWRRTKRTYVHQVQTLARAATKVSGPVATH